MTASTVAQCELPQLLHCRLTQQRTKVVHMVSLLLETLQAANAAQLQLPWVHLVVPHQQMHERPLRDLFRANSRILQSLLCSAGHFRRLLLNCYFLSIFLLRTAQLLDLTSLGAALLQLQELSLAKLVHVPSEPARSLLVAASVAHAAAAALRTR